MSRHSGRTLRPAFTLVELLVVIAIIGVLVSLLLPAVQAAREAARRSQCANNLKQLVLGVHLYHDAHHVIPMGWPSKTTVQAEWGWTVFILPFIEQEGLYDKLGVTSRRLHDLIGAGTDIPLTQTKLAVYRCPSDVTPKLLPGKNSGAPDYHREFNCTNCPADYEPATSNYVGNTGFFDPVPGSDGFENNGVFFGNGIVRFKDITDGLSNTFCIGERDERCRSGAWIGCRNPPGPDMWGTYFVRGRVSMKLNDPRPAASNRCTEGFSSKHRGGAQFAFCDGNVRFIPDSIHFSNGTLTEAQITNDRPALDVSGIGTYQRLGIRDDGVPVAGF